MKSVYLRFAFGSVLSFMIALGCFQCSGDGDSGEPCDEINALFDQGVDEACAGKTDQCCTCLCWSDNKQEPDMQKYQVDQTCECQQSEDDEFHLDCEDPGDKSSAQQCLKSESCKQNTRDTAKGMTETSCQLTPLDTWLGKLIEIQEIVYRMNRF